MLFNVKINSSDTFLISEIVLLKAIYQRKHVPHTKQQWKSRKHFHCYRVVFIGQVSSLDFRETLPLLCLRKILIFGKCCKICYAFLSADQVDNRLLLKLAFLSNPT